MTSPGRCPTCHRRLRRTNPQNALYWRLLHLISEGAKPSGQAFSPDTWHIYFKRRFLGAQDATLPNGEVIPMVDSTADLDVAAFGEYFDKVEAWAADHDIFLADHD